MGYQLEEARRQAAQAEAQKKQIQAELDTMKAQQTARPGIKHYAASEQERQAGVTPPSFEGMRDINTGELLKEFTFDPYSGEAVQALKGEAFGTSQDSPWLKLQRARELQDMDLASKQALQGMSQAQAQMAMTGGLSSGARERMSRGGARDIMLARQAVARGGTQARLGRQADLLGSFADLERQAQLENIGTRKQDLSSLSAFDANRYNQQMSAYGAKQAAEGQRAAAAASAPKGKCFMADVEVTMADMSKKKISEIEPGEMVHEGGLVVEARKFYDADGLPIFRYNGVLVTGSHAVLELNRWVRVEESVGAMRTDIRALIVFSLVTENHRIVVNDMVFGDDMETDEDYKNERMSLAAMNGAMF